MHAMPAVDWLFTSEGEFECCTKSGQGGALSLQRRDTVCFVLIGLSLSVGQIAD